MSKHTPGPWTVARNTDDGLDIISSDEVTYVEVALDVRTEADARLIAAAPDLLKALKEVEWAILPPDGSLAGRRCAACGATAKNGHVRGMCPVGAAIRGEEK